MTVTELISILQKYQDEIGCNGESIGSHSLKSTVQFVIANPELNISLKPDDSEYPGGIELDLICGCMCPRGIVFNLNAICN
jgi:hypothetical protein